MGSFQNKNRSKSGILFGEVSMALFCRLLGLVYNVRMILYWVVITLLVAGFIVSNYIDINIGTAIHVIGYTVCIVLAIAHYFASMDKAKWK